MTDDRRILRAVELNCKRVLISMALLSTIILLLAMLGTDAAHRFGNAVIPVWLLLTFSWIFYLVVKRERILLLTPIGNLLLTSLLVFGFGPLIMIFGPRHIYDELQTLFMLSPSEYFITHTTNVIGFLSLFAGLMVATHILRTRFAGRLRMARSAMQPDQQYRGRLILGVFTLRQVQVGALILVAIAIPVRLANIAFGFDLVEYLPGFLGVLRRSGWLALILLGILSRRVGGITWLLLIGLLLLEMAGGALTLMRGEMLTPLALVGLGLVLGGGSVWILPIVGAICFGLFFVAKPLIDTMRITTGWERSAIISEYSSLELRDLGEAGIEGAANFDWWARFNYAPIQGALIRDYDTGFPGDTYELIPWFFLPRFLFPGKPIIDAGPRVTSAVFDRPTQLGDSSTGPTVFGEAYWNGGWLMLIASSMIYGVLLAVVMYCCIWALLQGKIYSILIAIMGLLYGGAVNEFFSGSVIGSFVIFIGVFIILTTFLSRRIRILGGVSNAKRRQHSARCRL